MGWSTRSYRCWRRWSARAGAVSTFAIHTIPPDMTPLASHTLQ